MRVPDAKQGGVIAWVALNWELPLSPGSAVSPSPFRSRADSRVIVVVWPVAKLLVVENTILPLESPAKGPLDGGATLSLVLKNVSPCSLTSLPPDSLIFDPVLTLKS